MRKYKVRLIDSETKQVILIFTGNVVKKKQKSGKIAGDVIEDLLVKDYHIDIKKLKKSISKNKSKLK